MDLDRMPGHGSLEYKSAVGGVKVLDEGNGIVQAIVSVTNVVDNVKDNILPGAYRETLTRRVPKGLRGHDWNRMVAKTLHSEELLPHDRRVREIAPRVAEKGGGGLLIRGQYNLATQLGRDAYEDAKFFGDEMEWSVGYKVPTGKSAIVPKTGVREIKAMDLYEWSDVAFGAAPLTAGTTSVKSAIVGMIETGELTAEEIAEWANLAADEFKIAAEENEGGVVGVLTSMFNGLEAECEDCGCGCDGCAEGKTLHQPGDDGFETKVRKVRSPEGSRRYGLPIGTPLGRAKPKPPKGPRRGRRAGGPRGGRRGGGATEVESEEGDATVNVDGVRKVRTAEGAARTEKPVGDEVGGEAPEAPNLEPTELPESIQSYQLDKTAVAAIRELNPDFPGLSKMGPPDLVTDDVDEALAALAEGKNVELKQPRQVSSLLNRLVDVVNDAKKRDKQAQAKWEAGDNDPALYKLAQKAKADPPNNMQKFLDAGGKTEQLDDVEVIPDYNLCGISVKGTNLFCAQHKDKTRLTMPQLAGKPKPGSQAEKILEEQNEQRKKEWAESGRTGNWEEASADDGGPTNEADLSGHFRDYLAKELEIQTSQESAKASNLRASQRELVGANVAGMMLSMENTDEEGNPIDPEKRSMGPGRIFVSEDDYVVDGHHRWAAAVGVDLADNVEGDVDMDVERIPLPILVVLKIATDWSTEMGIPPKGGGKGAAGEAVAASAAQEGKKDDDVLGVLLKVLGFEDGEEKADGDADDNADDDALLEAVRDELAQIVEEFGADQLDDDDLPWIYDRCVEAVEAERSGAADTDGEKIVGAAAVVAGRRRGRGGPRKVRTPEGARFYGQSIGSIIKPGGRGRTGRKPTKPRRGRGRGPQAFTPHPLAPKPKPQPRYDPDNPQVGQESVVSVTRRGGQTFVLHHYDDLETNAQMGIREMIRQQGGLRKALTADLDFLARLLMRHIMGHSAQASGLTVAADQLLEDTMETKIEWTADDVALADQLAQLSEDEWGEMVNSLHDGDPLDKVKAICDQVEFELKGLDADEGDTRALHVHHWLEEFDLKYDDPSVPDEELAAAGDGLEVKVSSRAYPGLERSPKENWVEKAGGLPSYIERIAKHLHHERGMTISRAIATAISRCKKWAAGGENVSAATRAKAAKAIAQWEKLKAKNKARRKDDDMDVLDVKDVDVKDADALDEWILFGDVDVETKKDRTFSTEKRKEYAGEGVAMPGGRYPIPDKDALRRAINAFGRGNPPDKDAIKRHIIKRARALGATDMLPEGWVSGKDDKDDMDTPLDVIADLFPDLDLKMKKHRFMGKGGGKCGICKLGKDEGKHIGASEPNKEGEEAAEARDENEEDDDKKKKGKGKDKWVPPWKKSLEDFTEQDITEMAQLVDEWYEAKGQDEGGGEGDEEEDPDPDQPDELDTGDEEDAQRSANDPQEGPTVTPGMAAPGMGGETDEGLDDGEAGSEASDGDVQKVLDQLLEIKAGRVLSGSNAAAVRGAMDKLLTVLQKAGVDLSDLLKNDEKDKKPETADASAGDEEETGAEDASPFAAAGASAGASAGEGAKGEDGDGMVTISLAELMEAAELRLTADV